MHNKIQGQNRQHEGPQKRECYLAEKVKTEHIRWIKQIQIDT